MNIPAWKLFGWFSRPQLWATGDGQLHHNSIAAHASYLVQRLFAKHQITQMTQQHPPALPQHRFGTLWLLAFPKIKITFEREVISFQQWDSGNYYGAVEGDWENCVRSQGAYFEGDWGIIILCTMFLVSSSVNVSIFHSAWLDTFWNTSYVYLHNFLWGLKLVRVQWYYSWVNTSLLSAFPSCLIPSIDNLGKSTVLWKQYAHFHVNIFNEAEALNRELLTMHCNDRSN